MTNPLTSGGVRKKQSLPFIFLRPAIRPRRWQLLENNRTSGRWGVIWDGAPCKANRLWIGKKQIRIKSYHRDFGLRKLTNFWTGLGGPKDPIYVVQTNTRVIERCMLMTTDPGDLVLDPTCGSGTTAFVAEQWGRRWITCDTSRVALALARQRLMTARFSAYRLRDLSR